MFLRTGAINVTTATSGKEKQQCLQSIPRTTSRRTPALPAGADNRNRFRQPKELAKLAAEWPASRLVDTWNSFAGVAPFDDLKPVKKFTSRKAAVARIWQAVQRLSPDGAQPAADVAPAKGKSKKSPTKAPRRARAQKGATEARSNKKAEVIAMMRRAKGVTLAEIVEATGWQKHTVRGLRQHPGQQGRAEDRVLKELRRRAQLPHREVTGRRFGPLNAALAVAVSHPGALGR